MNPLLTELLVCPRCAGSLEHRAEALVCAACREPIPVGGDKPLFAPVAEGVMPSPKKERGLHKATTWRQANHAFFARAAGRIDAGAVVVDVGAGHGGFKDLFASKRYLGTDIYPYDEIDFVCDLTKASPFRPGSVDVFVLSNVFEHVREPHAFVGNLVRALRPGGRLLIAVPFLIKLHQQPYDFHRFTHHALAEMMGRFGLRIDCFEAVHTPFALARSMVMNLARFIPPDARAARLLATGVLQGLDLLGKTSAVPEPQITNLLAENNMGDAPVGYQLEAVRA